MSVIESSLQDGIGYSGPYMVITLTWQDIDIQSETRFDRRSQRYGIIGYAHGFDPNFA